jgi:FHA domain
MARLKCAACGAGVGKGDVVCRKCGHPLLEDGAVVAVPVPVTAEPEQQLSDAASQQDPASGEAQVLSAGQCPHCGATVPDSRNLVCLECFRQLEPAASNAGARTASSHADAHATFREADRPCLVMRFDFGAIELSLGQEMLLGRDAPDQQLAALRDRDNVSRLHATVGLTSDGAWVRDESSTNGTFVNGRPVEAGAVVALTEGAELRLASNVRATVELRKLDHHD